eukprot:434632_1
MTSNTNTNLKKEMIPIFLALTKKLLSTDNNKRNQRINLSKKITSTIINKHQFLSQLNTASNSNHLNLCQRCIDLLQHKDSEIRLFAKLLFHKIINNNILSHTMIEYIFDSYSNIIPKTLIESNNTSDNIIISKLQTITEIIDETHNILLNNSLLQSTYSNQMISLKSSFIKLIHTLCPPKFDAIPYKLPSPEVQTILIEFWSKYNEYIPHDISFRTMYLLRWICVLSFDFDENILNKLLNIMISKFNDKDISDTSESVLMLFGILAFLGGSTISTCDNHSPSILLYKILDKIPLSSTSNLNNNFHRIIQSVNIDTLTLIIDRAHQFPDSNNIKLWKQCFANNLQKNNYFIPYMYKVNRFSSSRRLCLTDKSGLTNTNWTTCYMNSIIQTLFISDRFRERILSLKSLKYNENKNKNKNIFQLNKYEWIKTNLIMNELQNIFYKLKQKRKIICTKRFVNMLPIPWSLRQQQDGHQFVKYILDLLCETIKHSNINVDKDPFFDGLQCGYTKCCNCGNITKKYDKFNELPLSIDFDNDNVNGLIDKYFDIEKLTDDNKYKCDKCKKIVDAMRYFKIMEAPQNLIICLKRMEWKCNKYRIEPVKNSKFIKCPLTVSLPVENDDEKIEYKLMNEKYLLYGAVIHSGISTQCGHYYSIGRHTNNAIKSYNESILDNNKWYKFDDTNVTMSTYEKLCKSNEYYGSHDVPYLLFYKKVNHNNINEK